MNNSTQIYCDHFSKTASARGVYYEERDNTLKNTTTFTPNGLKQYLRCDQCKVLTPMINENPGKLDFFKLRARICYYFVLSKFATLLSLPIRNNVDPVKHPYLVKFARICALQNQYYRSLKIELSIYKNFWEPVFSKKMEERDQNQVINMKLDLIAPYYNRELLRRYTYAEPEEVAHEQHETFFKVVTLKPGAYDKERLENLRTKEPGNMGFRDFDFQRLFDMGLLAKPPVKETEKQV